MKLKRSSIEYETVADIEIDDGSASPKPQLLSPDGTPQYASPPSTISSPKVKREEPPNMRKRKSSAHMSLSDGEENSRLAVKRPSLEANVSMQRKSPRKSLKSLAMASPSTENILPLPSQNNQFYPPVGAGAGLETARPLLTPLSSNDLNGAARPATTSPSSFTPVNTTSGAPPSASHARNYSSPYGPPGPQIMTNTQHAPTVQAQHAPSIHTQHTPGIHTQHTPILHTPHAPIVHAQQPPIVHAQQPPIVHAQQPPIVNTPYPPIVTTTSSIPSGFHAVNTPIPSNGSSARNSPIIQNMSYANIAPHPAPPSHPTPALQAIAAPVSPRSAHALHTPPAPPAQKILKSQPSETPLTSADTELLQCELLGSLMQYFFPKPDAKPNEATLLRNLEYLWSLKSMSFRHQMGHLYDIQAKVLLAWIEERRKISQLRYSMENEPGVLAPEMVDRLLAMNDLRVLRLKWKTMNTQDGSQTLSPEDLLCKDFAVMTNTEGTEYLFKDGLDKLNDSMFEFLRSEDMKIMMSKR